MADTPLKNIPNWSPDHVSKMKEVWVNTAEQVVALSATEGGITSIAEQLNTSEEEARELVESAGAVIPADTLKELKRSSETKEYGLGALRPENEKDR